MLHPLRKISPSDVVESSAIQWILTTSTEPEVRHSAIELIPSVQWTVTLAAASLEYIDRYYWSWRVSPQHPAVIMAHIHLALTCDTEFPKYLYIVQTPAGTTLTPSREVLLVKQALFFFQNEEEIEISPDITDQMNLVDPWLSHVLPLLLQYRKKRWGLSQPIVLRATLSLEGYIRQAYDSLTEDTPRADIANALVSMAILLHVEVDSELLIMRNKSFHLRPIIASILTALCHTLFSSKVIDQGLLDEKVDLALQILPMFVRLSDWVDQMWCNRFNQSLYDYTDRDNKSIWGIRWFFSLLADYRFLQKHTFAPSFLSLALSTLDRLSEHVRCDILTLSNQTISLDDIVQYMRLFGQGDLDDESALCDILFITGTMSWDMMDPNLDVSAYLGLLIRYIRLAECRDGSILYISTLSHFALHALSALEDHHFTNERNRWLTPDLSHSLLAIKGNRLINMLLGIRLHKWVVERQNAFMKSEGYMSILYLRFIFRMMQHVDWYHSVLSDGHLERVMGFIPEFVEMSTQGKPDWLRDSVEQHLKFIPRILKRTWAGAPYALRRLPGHKGAIKGLIEQSWNSVTVWSQGCRTSFCHLNISSKKDLMESTAHLIRLTSYWDCVWDIEYLPRLTGAVQKMKEEVEVTLLQFRSEPETDGLVRESILPSISKLIQRLQDQWLRVNNKDQQSLFMPVLNLSTIEKVTEESLE